MEKEKKILGRWLENYLREHALRKVCKRMSISEVCIQLARSLCVVVNVLRACSEEKKSDGGGRDS